MFEAQACAWENGLILTNWRKSHVAVYDETCSRSRNAGRRSGAGCATKGFVREQVAVVNQRVDGLETKLQATDTTAQQALSEAQAASGQAQQNGQRLDQLNARVDGVEQQMQQAQRKRARN